MEQRSSLLLHSINAFFVGAKVSHINIIGKTHLHMLISHVFKDLIAKKISWFQSFLPFCLSASISCTYWMISITCLLVLWFCANYKSQVKITNYSYVSVIGYGNVYLSKDLILKHVLYVPKCTSSLISISTIINSHGYHVVFDSKKATIYDSHLRMKIGEP